MIRSSLLTSLLLVTLSFATPRSVQAEDKPAAATDETQLAKQLIGTWILVGKPGQIGEAPASGGRLQFFTGTHWLITQANPKTGVVIFHHGGTYSLNGDVLEKKVEYANQNTAGYIGNTRSFKITVEGDTYTQTGIDNEFNEVWKRVK
jgi:hypothetical protein